MNLNVKLMAILLLVGLLPSIGIGVYSFVRTQAALVDETEIKIAILEANVLTRFNYYVQTATNQAAGLARTYDVFQSLNILRENDGDEGSVAWQERLALLHNVMPEVQKLSNYALVNVIDSRGVVVYSTDSDTVGVNLSDRDYYVGARQGRITTSEIFYSSVVRDHVIALGIPIYSQGGAGEITGVFSVILESQYLEAVLLEGASALGAMGDAYLVDRDGVLLTRPRLNNQAKVLETRVNSLSVQRVTSAIRAGDAHYVSEVESYTDYTGNRVMGMSGTLNMGGNLVGLIIEVDETEAMAVSNTLRNVMLTTGAVVAIILAVLGWYVARSISRPILIAVAGLGQGSDEVASASVQLASASQQLASGNAQQASAIQETSATLEETSSMVLQNTENTRQAASLSGQAKEAAEKGNVEMQQMMTSMAELKKSSDQIGKIIKVIDNIAFQTNILALNAAVEAARAGDAGMGFAVVAEEVRNLAQRSAQAASDTASIIETNIELSQQGVDGAQRVGNSLGEIALLSKKVNELVDEVAAASLEQTQGISQVNQAIVQIEQATQENAASSEESATASEQLNAQAANMKEIVGDLVRLVNGAKAGNVTLSKSKNAERVEKASPTRAKAPAASSIKPKDTKKKAARPEEIIPLEEDSQF